MHIRHRSVDTDFHLEDDKTLEMVVEQEQEREQAQLKVKEPEVQIVSPPPMPTFEEMLSALKTLFSLIVTIFVYFVYFLVYILVFVSQTLTTVINGIQVTSRALNTVQVDASTNDGGSVQSEVETIESAYQNESEFGDIDTAQSITESDNFTLGPAPSHDDYTIKSGPARDNYTLKTAVHARSEVASIYKALRGHRQRRRLKDKDKEIKNIKNISIEHFDDTNRLSFTHHLRNCSYCASLNKDTKETPDFTKLAMDPYFATVFDD